MFKTVSIATTAAFAMLFTSGCGSYSMAGAKRPAMFSGGALAAPSGMTLYTFDRDTANSGRSACQGRCATVWPPLLAGSGDQPVGDYSIVTRDGGSRQWAFQGRPVYTYEADRKAGDRTGDNADNAWHVIVQ